MIDKQARQYLQEMDIDVWLKRASPVSKSMPPSPSWPLVVIIEPSVLEQHLALFKGIVAAMKLEWADIHTCSAAHYPEASDAWILWADPTNTAPKHPKILSCDPQQLATDKQAKRVLWQQICAQILN
ncbi:DNA polymerase III subunit psi [Agarivorans sp. Alg241-V36]|uniref:DNA polymerase III subunit psi n=1 Tax=Agarivorans sp. Alg241-V36 TaxID=2305992 RepID=UPI0013D0601B|nr:DNA polymerase III subunit psi [Agarivorans sp. Alg241-V36]